MTDEQYKRFCAHLRAEEGPAEGSERLEFTHEEIALLMRALLRSLPETREGERKLHEQLYSRLGKAFAETLPPGVLESIGKVMQ